MALSGHARYVYHRAAAAGPPSGADLCAGARLAAFWTRPCAGSWRAAGRSITCTTAWNPSSQCAANASSSCIPEADGRQSAHGKMSEEQLVRRHAADARTVKSHILVCTTIIETGIDIPNVNTLIIEDADRLGLVAAAPDPRPRRAVRAAARMRYLTLPQGEGRCPRSRKSGWTAIREFAEFGSGFKHRHARPGDPRRGRSAGRGAVRPYDDRGLRYVPAAAGGRRARRAAARRRRRNRTARRT